MTVWLKKHFTEPEQIDERKGEMKALLQTTDKRTVRRRLERLKEQAARRGITGWVEMVVAKLPSLLCTIGSVRLPATSNAIERLMPEAARMPLYRLINDPFRALGELKNVKPETAMADFLLAEAAEA